MNKSRRYGVPASGFFYAFRLMLIQERPRGQVE
jgi:hypothetical protein